MKRMYFLFCFLATGAFVLAQKTANKIDLKMSTGLSVGSYSRFVEFPQFFSKEVQIDFGCFGASVAISKRAWLIHEIGLAGWGIDKTMITTATATNINGQQFTLFWGGLNTKSFAQFFYEANFRHKFGKTTLSMGFNARPYVEVLRVIPLTSVVYSNTQHVFGQTLGLTPRMTFDLSKQVYLDINFPVDIFDMYVRYHKVDDPALTQAQQTTVTTHYAVMPFRLHCRVGVGVRLAGRGGA